MIASTRPYPHDNKTSAQIASFKLYLWPNCKQSINNNGYRMIAFVISYSPLDGFVSDVTQSSSPWWPERKG